MVENKSNIALLLGDPAGIGPELVSKLLNDDITKKANIVVIGEKQVFESGNSITGFSHQLNIVESFDQIDFNKSNKFFLDISKGKNQLQLLSNYLPIQKFENIFPSISSFVICPVISPIESIAFLRSIDNRSPEISFSKPFSTSAKDIKACDKNS